ncbi:copper chaperone PCu(A)C [Streptomyces sp. SID9727]|uniref:copper chaperone PCu(A)C n=1 Tax=Streptomyces sp. SID9727 TaxID=2706114 RepID=UPI0013CBA740|nr:copper chaperone PCu(A)C [Streptomyces sp. SID9727]
MSRSLRHGALAATAIAFSITALTACGAGNNAQTLEVRPDNASTRSGDIKIQNVNVITQPEREAKGPAVVTATLFNSGSKPETLDSITLKGGSGTVQLHPAEGSGPVVVPAGGRVILGGRGNASAVIENGDEATENGDVQPLVFKLSRSGDISLGASVVPATHYFKGFGPSALPEPSKTPDASPSGSPTGSASPDASESPSGEAGASASESGQPG